jgi:putative ABC transport system permease protein
VNGKISSFRANSREHGASITVAALSGGFGVFLLQITAMLSVYIDHQNIAQHDTAQAALAILTVVFTAIAMYVGAIVTTNTFATIIAGRRRSIALMRLIGATASAIRRAVAVEGVIVGVLGALIGAVVGVVLSLVVLAILLRTAVIPSLNYPMVSPYIVAPVVVVVLSTWAASWVGSRRVIAVTPLEAIGTAAESSATEARAHSGRNALSAIGFFVGLALLGFGIAAGRSSVFGLPIAFVGGLLSFAGLTLGAQLFIPWTLRAVGVLFGRGAAARLAAQNAVRYPERSTRTTIGLVIGVTLITTLTVASQTFDTLIQTAQSGQPQLFAGATTILNVLAEVFGGLIGFSVIVAAVGVINNLSLSVVQRSRELGLLRALGLSARQIRSMILIESAHMTLTATLIGLVLGLFYGWAGAQALLGSVARKEAGIGFVPLSIPWLFIVIAIAVSFVFATAASVRPIRRAVRLSPVDALAIE